VLLLIVIRLPAVPDRLKLVNVLVVLAVNVIVAGWVVFVISLNVLDPLIVNAPAPPWFKVQLYVEPPPKNVLAVAAVIEIVPVPVPAVVVKLLGCVLLKANELAPGQTNVPPLKVMFLMPAATIYCVPTVSVLPLRSILPLVCVKFRAVPIVSASCSCHVPLTPLNPIGKSRVLPLVVMVLVPEVAAKVSATVVDGNVIPAEIVRFPYTVASELLKVPANPVKLTSRHVPLVAVARG